MPDTELWAKAQEHAEALCDLLLPDNRHKDRVGQPYWFVIGFLVGSLTSATQELSKRAKEK
jgi:hypothetical protein